MRRGFSLIETIFAASILSIVLMVLFNLYPSSLLAVRRAEHRLEATTLAQSILESKRAMPFSQLTGLTVDTDYEVPGSDPTWTDPLTPPAGDPGQAKTRYIQQVLSREDGVVLRPRFRVFTVAGTDPTRLLGLRVTVEWDEKSAVHQGTRKTERIVQELLICDIRR